jgi:D,D-heptose 1,7-bisphosphate phosphatase
MLPVSGKPLLLHQIDLLKRYGMTEIFILVNHLKHIIIDSLGNGSAQGVTITYIEEPVPLGTVGGLKEIEEQLVDDFLVLYGDVMIGMDINRLINFHRKTDSSCTLVVHPNDHPYDSDLLEIDNTGRVIRFFPKPHDPLRYYPNLVNAGIYIFSPEIFKYIEKGKKADFGREIFPFIYDKIKIFGYNTSEYLKDMGTPERLKEVENDFRSGKIMRSNYEYKQKAIFLDRDGVINEEISFISKPEEFRLYNYTPSSIRKINTSGYKAIVVTNQSVIARNLCTFEELRNIHNKMETELGSHRAKIDALYFCPHHPDKGFPEERTEYKIDCMCRKPKPGMFFEAANDHNIDLSQSFMIGDSERDIEAGVNAGCLTVGLMSGYGTKKTAHMPDFFFADLEEAVDFIVDEPYRHVYNELLTLKLTSPAVILIGGNARSGKSTLARYLRLKLEQDGKRVLHIGLDNWILPESDRNNAGNVYDRFQLHRIEVDVQQILAGMDFTIMSYPNHPERKPESLSFAYHGQDFVLIDGVVALSSEVIRDLSHWKLFVEIPRDLHRERFRKYYEWRGKTNIEIEELYKKRLEDEYRYIEKERRFADFIVNSTSV